MVQFPPSNLQLMPEDLLHCELEDRVVTAKRAGKGVFIQKK